MRAVDYSAFFQDNSGSASPGGPNLAGIGPNLVVGPHLVELQTGAIRGPFWSSLGPHRSIPSVDAGLNLADLGRSRASGARARARPSARCGATCAGDAWRLEVERPEEMGAPSRLRDLIPGRGPTPRGLVPWLPPLLGRGAEEGAGAPTWSAGGALPGIWRLGGSSSARGGLLGEKKRRCVPEVVGLGAARGAALRRDTLPRRHRSRWPPRQQRATNSDATLRVTLHRPGYVHRLASGRSEAEVFAKTRMREELCDL